MRRIFIDIKSLLHFVASHKMNPKDQPCDGKRMFWGGFKTMVELGMNDDGYLTCQRLYST